MGRSVDIAEAFARKYVHPAWWKYWMAVQKQLARARKTERERERRRDPEKVREYYRRYCAKHREKERERNRRYRAEHLEHLRECKRQRDRESREMDLIVLAEVVAKQM